MNSKKPMKIILSDKGASSGHEKKNHGVNIAYPDHLTLSTLPVVKTIGSVPVVARVRNIGSVVHRKAGSRVHFCSVCDHPIAIYGRLSPCGHAFCLDCARSDSKCTIAEPITTIQTINMDSGIFICGMITCLKSFLKQDELNNHIKECHGVAGSSSANNSEEELQ